MKTELVLFNRTDIPTLLDWLADSDEEFLLQFAGPHYSFPLTSEQIQHTMADNSSRLFKEFDIDFNQMIGHCQLLRIDEERGTAAVGRMLVKPGLRGKGYGVTMLNHLSAFAFQSLALRNLTLKVFRFNTPAIHCYNAAGFTETASEDRYFHSINKTWNCITMVRTNVHQDYHE